MLRLAGHWTVRSSRPSIRRAHCVQPHAAPEHLEARLAETEKRNLRLYGYGVKGFTLSMIETALEVTEGRVPTQIIGEILSIGYYWSSHAEDVKEKLAAGLPHIVRMKIPEHEKIIVKDVIVGDIEFDSGRSRNPTSRGMRFSQEAFFG